MAHLIYNLSILAYRITLALVSPFNSKARKLIEGKKSWQSAMASLPEKKTKETKRVWFHCASLGEFEQGRPVIEALKNEINDISIIITFFSPSGYEVRRNYRMADLVLYLPWDTGRNARIFFDTIDPDLVVFIKYEFWRNFLKESAKRQITTVLVSGIFRPGQLFFKPFSESYRKVLDYFDHFFIQNQKSKDLLTSIGVTNTTISGDTRFDRVFKVAQDAEEIPVVEKFMDSTKVLISGSVWQEDLDVIIPLINDPELDLKHIIAPHEIDPGQIESWRKKFLPDSVLFSQVLDLPSFSDIKVLIIDNVGMLSRLYRYGNFAFIGGAFGPGLHNTLEAAAFGMPVFFGNKNFSKYQEALDLIDLEVGYSIGTSREFKKIITNLMADQGSYTEKCRQSRQYVASKTGATRIISEYLINKLKEQ